MTNEILSEKEETEFFYTVLLNEFSTILNLEFHNEIKTDEQEKEQKEILENARKEFKRLLNEVGIYDDGQGNDPFKTCFNEAKKVIDRIENSIFYYNQEKRIELRKKEQEKKEQQKEQESNLLNEFKDFISKQEQLFKINIKVVEMNERELAKFEREYAKAKENNKVNGLFEKTLFDYMSKEQQEIYLSNIKTEFENQSYFVEQKENIDKIVFHNSQVRQNIEQLLSKLWYFDNGSQGVIIELANDLLQAKREQKEYKKGLSKLPSFVYFDSIVNKISEQNLNREDKKVVLSVKNKIDNTFKALKRVIKTDSKLSEKEQFFSIENKEHNEAICFLIEQIKQFVFAFGWNEELNLVSKENLSENIQVFENATKELNVLTKEEKKLAQGEKLEQEKIIRQELLGQVINQAIILEFINPYSCFASEELKKLFYSLTNEKIKEQKNLDREEQKELIKLGMIAKNTRIVLENNQQARKTA